MLIRSLYCDMSEQLKQPDESITKRLTSFVEDMASKSDTWTLDDASKLGYLADVAGKASITIDFLVDDWTNVYGESHEEDLPATRLFDHTIRFNLPSKSPNSNHPTEQSVVAPTVLTIDLDNNVVFILQGVIESKNDRLEANTFINRLIELERDEDLIPSPTTKLSR